MTTEYDWIAQAQARRYRGYLGGAIELDDLVQEGRLGIMHGMARYREDGGASRATWATKWARAYIHRHLERHLNGVLPPTGASGVRRRGQIMRVPTRPMEDVEWSLGEPDAEPREHRLGRALDALPERWRYLITERYLEERSLQSLADERGVKRQAVDNVIRRALGRLREELSP